MTATPLWFGPPAQPCFGWLHRPDDGQARAGVLLCPPIGYEYICSHRTFRSLAERLSASGFAALRFDYAGSGDSAADHRAPGQVEAWQATIGHAAELLRGLGVPSIAAVGMRLGATMVALEGAGATDLGAIVLWDPTWSGRALARQLRAVHLVGTGGADGDAADGSIQAAGIVYSAETLGDLRACALPDLSSTVAPVLVLTRPEQPPTPGQRALLPECTTWEEASGQAELLDVESPHAVVPHASMRTVLTWLDQTLPRGLVPCQEACGAARAGVGAGVTEELRRFGPHGLFGIVAEAKPVAGRPALLCINNAADHHIGPNRLWVDWGRDLAADGFRVVRFDIGGIGDSPTRAGCPDDLSYPPQAAEDVAAVAAEIDDGSGVVLIGMCSGGYHAVIAGAAIPAKGVCALNFATYLPPAVLQRLAPEAPEPPERVASRLGGPRLRRQVRALLARIPAGAWAALDRANLFPSRTRMLEPLADRAVDSLVVWGEDEVGLLKINDTSAWALERLRRRPGFRVEIVPGLDHALMRRAARERVVALMTDHLHSRFAGDVNRCRNRRP